MTSTNRSPRLRPRQQPCPPTSYAWQPGVDQRILEQLGKESEPHGQGVGAGRQKFLRFRALQAGETEIAGEYLRPWQEERCEMKHFSGRMA